jgi:hypothetical protein
VYDVILTHDGASVILDNFQCDVDECLRDDPRENSWQIIDGFSAILVYGHVEQMHDLSPYLGGVWVSEDQEILYVSATGDVETRTELLRFAGLDVDSPYVEVVQAAYTMVELEAVAEAIGADSEVLIDQFNAHSRRIDIIANVVVVSTSETDTSALATYLSESYPPDLVTVEGGVEARVYHEA